MDALAGLVLEAVGRADMKPVHASARPGAAPRLWVDPGKLREATSFRPRTSLANGLAATVAYYRELFAAQPDCLSQMQTRNWEVA